MDRDNCLCFLCNCLLYLFCINCICIHININQYRCCTTKLNCRHSRHCCMRYCYHFIIFSNTTCPQCQMQCLCPTPNPPPKKKTENKKKKKFFFKIPPPPPKKKKFFKKFFFFFFGCLFGCR